MCSPCCGSGLAPAFHISHGSQACVREIAADENMAMGGSGLRSVRENNVTISLFFGGFIAFLWSPDNLSYLFSTSAALLKPIRCSVVTRFSAVCLHFSQPLIPRSSSSKADLGHSSWKGSSSTDAGVDRSRATAAQADHTQLSQGGTVKGTRAYRGRWVLSVWFLKIAPQTLHLHLYLL